MRLRRHHGFTLIELIVVVAIIGILAAVAIPAFMKNARKAKTAEAITEVTKVYEAAHKFSGAGNGTFAPARDLYEAGYIDAVTAANFGADPSAPKETDNAAGGRADGYLFVYEVSPDRQHFLISAVPAAVGRSGDTSISIDDSGVVRIVCPPGTKMNQLTHECEPLDNFLAVKALRALRGIDALSNGRALNIAQQLVTKDMVFKVLTVLDTNHDARLSLDEMLGADVDALGRMLHKDFGKQAAPRPPASNTALNALVTGYLDTVRDDLAPGIAGAPDVSVPIGEMTGDVAAFLALAQK